LVKPHLQHFVPSRTDVLEIRHRPISLIRAAIRSLRSHAILPNLSVQLPAISCTGKHTVRYSVEPPVRLHSLLASSVLARQISDLWYTRPVVIAYGSECALEVGELVLDLRIIAFVLFSCFALAGFPVQTGNVGMCSLRK
jgi:hypothetical protein